MTDSEYDKNLTDEERERRDEFKRQWNAITAPVVAAAREWRSLQHIEGVRKDRHMVAEMDLAKAIDTYNISSHSLGMEEDAFVRRVVNRIKSEK